MHVLTRALVGVVIATIRVYQMVLSPWLGPACRFQPTCSEYMMGAFRTHGVMGGGWLALRRLGRCHPLGGEGFDPVPERGIGGS